MKMRAGFVLGLSLTSGSCLAQSATKWTAGFDVATVQARKLHRPMLVVVNENQGRMRSIMSAIYGMSGSKQLNRWILVQVTDPQTAVLLRRKFKVTSTPILLFLSPSGDLITKSAGYHWSGLLASMMDCAEQLYRDREMLTSGSKRLPKISKLLLTLKLAAWKGDDGSVSRFMNGTRFSPSFNAQLREIFIGLATTSLAGGDLTKASTYFEKAIGYTFSQSALSASQIRLAFCQMRLGQPNKAVTLLRTALANPMINEDEIFAASRLLQFMPPTAIGTQTRR